MAEARHFKLWMLKWFLKKQNCYNHFVETNCFRVIRLCEVMYHMAASP